MTLPVSTRSSVTESAALAQTFLDRSKTLDDGLGIAVPAMQMCARKVSVTSAQLLAAFTTPVELVPAPGAGRANIVHGITARLTYGSAAYATNTTVTFSYTNGAGAKVSADMAALITAIANKTQFVSGVTTALTPVANAAVVLAVATGNPVSGNSPVEFTVHYSEVECL